ncbi:hypothetical protein AK88_00803 [Plasmodium fragile]|uniref:Uncharacterized protein n=1 Tax=Plasmodium fragile TaxID=5857 RepID=A0A0D9QS48_PLAFR|nr:uncharacterized protein AK88_00803 [Plasmodium fragile]KJP89592.1 hypothetical protein AK88_00803 [Plasmodium fragile]
MMKTNHSNVRSSFVYSEKVNELVEKVIFLAKSLSHYRKKYVTFLKETKCDLGGDNGSYKGGGDIRQRSLSRSGNSDTGGGVKGTRGTKNYPVKCAKYSDGSHTGCSFFHVFTTYEEFVHDLLHLCSHETDIYIEFLYALIINSELFNHFLYICTFTSGDKDDGFLLLIYKHFLTLVEYYFYFHNCHYFNELYRTLKEIYDNKDVCEAQLRVPPRGCAFLRKNDKNCLTSQATYEQNDSATWTEGENNFLFSYPNESNDFVNYEHSGVGNKQCEMKSANRNTNRCCFEVNTNCKTFKDEKKDLINEHNVSTFTKGVKERADNDSRSKAKCDDNTIETHKITHSGTILRKFLSHSSGGAEGDNQGDFHCNYNCDLDYGDKKKKHTSSQRQMAHPSNALFNVNNFYKLKNMFLMFSKLNYEHLYILLYFSLSILPTLFHVYLTRVLTTPREESCISPYLMYIAKRIKERSIRFFKFECNDTAGDSGYPCGSCTGQAHNAVHSTGSIKNKHLFKGYVQKGLHGKGRRHERNQRGDGGCRHQRHGAHAFWDEPNDKLWEHINRLDVQAKLDTLDSGGDANVDYSSVFRRNISMLHAFEIRADFESLNYEVVDEPKERSDIGKKRNSENKPNGNAHSDSQRCANESSPANQQHHASGEATSKVGPKEGRDSNIDAGSPHDAHETASIHSVPLMSSQHTPLYNAEKELQEVLKRNLQWTRIHSFYQSELKTPHGLQNASGLKDFIKSISIMCSEQFFSFYMNRIDMKKSTQGDYHLLQVDQCSTTSMKHKTEEEAHWAEQQMRHPGNHLHMPSLHKDTTLIHNDYIKKKIKRNRLYTYKIFNNQIETLLNSKELAEYIKKQKENKKKKKKHQQEKKKENFIYMQSQGGCPLLNKKNKKKISDVPFTFAQNKNDNFIESDCNSYENSDSSDNLSLYNYAKEFYADNGFNINEFVFFVLNTFYLFMHIHNVYFSCTYLNVLLSYSIKLVFKYSDRCVGSRLSRVVRGHLPDIQAKPHDTHEEDILPFMTHNRMKKIARKGSSVRVMKSHTQEGDINGTINNPQEGSEWDRINELSQMILRKKKFFNKKKKKEKKNLNSAFSRTSNKYANKNTLLMNTFDIIVNSFLDLCISLCSVDFNCVSDKRKRLNRSYFCNCICMYHHMLNRQYKESAVRKFNQANYNNSLEAYLFYFDELKRHALFSERFPQEGKREVQEEEDDEGGGRDSRSGYNRSDSTHITNHSDASGYSLYFSQDKRRRDTPHLGVSKRDTHRNKEHDKSGELAEGVKKNGAAKRLLKKKKKMDDSIFSYMMMARARDNITNDISSSMNETEEDHDSDDGPIDSINTSSDGSFLFLKKMKKKIKKRIYLDENNIIKMLTSVGCIFMNNIKYSVGITISNLKRIHKHGSSNEKDNLFNHLHGVFYWQKKNAHLANIYNQYFVSFLFFFKIHYLFFLIKYKCEHEIFLKAYWFLYAVYSITQGGQ